VCSLNKVPAGLGAGGVRTTSWLYPWPTGRIAQRASGDCTGWGPVRACRQVGGKISYSLWLNPPARRILQSSIEVEDAARVLADSRNCCGRDVSQPLKGERRSVRASLLEELSLCPVIVGRRIWECWRCVVSPPWLRAPVPNEAAFKFLRNYGCRPLSALGSIDAKIV
jgi:hypothetical protein